MADNTTLYLILGLSVSVLANFIILVVVFGTGVGKRVVQRIKQRWLYKRGQHANIIYIRNNHVAHELFTRKNSDGSVAIEDKRYIINPLSTFLLDGIPTQINHEGITEPYNIFTDKDSEAMSTAEIEKIIMNNEIGDLVAMLKKYFPLFIIFMLIMIGFVIASSYFNWKIFDAITQTKILDIAMQIGSNVTEVATR